MKKQHTRHTLAMARQLTIEAMAVGLKPGQMSPVEYLLDRINDATVASDTRDRLAIATAPYCHPRLSEPLRVGKKEKAEKAAKVAGIGSGWGSDLEFENRASQ